MNDMARLSGRVVRVGPGDTLDPSSENRADDVNE